MRITRTQLSFLAVLGAGALLMVGTLLSTSRTTFGSETDAQRISDLVIPGSGGPAPAASQPASQPSASGQTAALPPQAPIDVQGGTNAASPSAGEAGVASAKLPNAGTGGYLNSDRSTVYASLLAGLGLVLLASGSAIWAYSRRRV